MLSYFKVLLFVTFSFLHLNNKKKSKLPYFPFEKQLENVSKWRQIYFDIKSLFEICRK